MAVQLVVNIASLLQGLRYEVESTVTSREEKKNHNSGLFLTARTLSSCLHGPRLDLPARPTSQAVNRSFTEPAHQATSQD